eukprot:Hpha_TRINITY_DN7544_c0_g1::TRINITY_DN7544_c0_g1_i2::g.19001::m.19001/K08281/pncA; nicotinamidase/pyrazinamidase
MQAPGGLEQWTKLLAEGKGDTQAAPTRLTVPMRAGDVQNDFMPGGAMDVPESERVLEEVLALIQAAGKVGAKVIVSRAYHPADSCAFLTRKGPFPPHCIQGGDGALLINDVKDAVAGLRGRSMSRGEQGAHVCFKGFVEDTASYGVLPYDGAFATGRLPIPPGSPGPQLEWTGAFELHCSALDEDLNAPPDLRSVLRRKPARELLWGMGDRARLFVCGFAMDFSVLDTACCATTLGIAALEGVHIIFDATRPFWHPTLGRFSGFMSSPREVAKKLNTHGVRLCLSADVRKGSPDK